MANDLGNLLNRMASLAERNNLSTVPQTNGWSEAAATLQKEATEALQEYSVHMEKYEFHLALARLWKFINQTDKFKIYSIHRPKSHM